MVAVAVLAGCPKPPDENVVDGGSQPVADAGTDAGTVEALRLSSFPPSSALAGAPFSYQATLSHGGDTSWRLLAPPAGATVSATGLVQWAPTASSPDQATFHLRALQGAAYADQVFTVQVGRPVVQASASVTPSTTSASLVSVTAPLSPIRGSGVSITPGALPAGAPVTLTVSQVQNAPVPPSAKVAGVTSADLKTVEFGPTGLVFAQPVKIYVPVSAAVLAKGTPVVQTLDYATGTWETLPALSVDAQAGVVVAEVRHFSTYVATPPSDAVALSVHTAASPMACSGKLVARPSLHAALTDIPASSVNGSSGTGTAADVLAGLTEGQALQVLSRVQAVSADGSTNQWGWTLFAAQKVAAGYTLTAVSDQRPDGFLNLPAAPLAGTDPELLAWLSGSRADIVLGQLSGAASVTADVSLYLVASADATRPPRAVANPVGSLTVSGATFAAYTADQDCDGAPDTFDAQPAGDPPPTLTASPDVDELQLTQGTPATLRVSAAQTGTTFTWSSSDLSAGVTVSADGSSAAIPASAPGFFRVGVVATLGTGQSSRSWRVTVNPPATTNTAPTVGIAASVLTVHVGEHVSLLAISKDAEQAQDSLQIRWSASTGAVLTAASGSSNGFSAADPGTYVVTAIANDGLLDSTPATVTLTVIAADVNRAPSAPTVTPLSATLTRSGGSVSATLTASATDPDGDAVSYEFFADPANPAGATLTSSGATATFTATLDGVYHLYAVAHDGRGGTSAWAEATFQVFPASGTTSTDNDHDGYPSTADCNDRNADIHPGAVDVCGDGIDQDCSGADLKCAVDAGTGTGGTDAGSGGGTADAGVRQDAGTPAPDAGSGGGATDAGVPPRDGGSGGGSADAGTGAGPGLHGRKLVHSLNGASETAVPVDFSATLTIQGQAMGPAGTFDTYGGFGDADGGFFIPNLPSGPHYVSLTGKSFYWSTEASDDLSQYVLGRPDPVAATVDTQLTWNGSGMSFPWAAGDEIQLTSEGAGIGWFDPVSLGLPFDPGAGASSFSVNVPYLQWTGAPLIESAKGDAVYVTHLSKQPASAGMLSVLATQEYYQSNTLNMSNGPVSNVLDGTFTTTAPPASATVTLPVSTWASLASSVFPSATIDPNGLQFAIDASPGGLSHGNIGGAPDLVYASFDPATSGDATFSVSYINPFPPSWTEMFYTLAIYDVRYTNPLNPTGQKRFLFPQAGSLDTRASTASLGGGPVMTPVTKLSINSASAQVAQANVGTSPVISWLAPTRTPTRYLLRVFQFDADANFGKQQIATLLAPRGTTQVQLPFGLLSSNKMYAVQVRAIDDGTPAGSLPNEVGFPYYYAEAVTNLFSVDATVLGAPPPPADAGTPGGGVDAGSGGGTGSDAGIPGGGGADAGSSGGGTDGGSSGGGGTDAGSGSALNGTQAIHHINNGVDQVVPVDLSTLTTIQAQTANPSGGLDWFMGSGASNGTYSIPNVPAGPHYVSLNGSTYFWSIQPSDDLSSYTLGRGDGVAATPDTQLTWSGDGMTTPWANGDQLQFNSEGAGIGFFNAQQLGLNVNAVAGGTSFSATFPYATWVGSSLIDGTRGDTTYVTRLVQQPVAAGQKSVLSLQESYQTGTLTMVNGADAGNTLSGTFGLTGTQESVTVTFPVGAYNALASAVHPTATTNQNGLLFYVDASPGGLAHGNLAGAPDMVIATLDPAASSDPGLSVDYRDPFPASWEHFYASQGLYDIQYTHPGNGKARFLTGNIMVQDTPAAMQARGLAPMVTPVRNLRINGQPAQGGNLGALGLTPTISWDLPSQGSLTKYAVTVWSFDNTATFTKRRVATLRAPGNVTSLQIPEGVLQYDVMYAVVVRGYQDGTVVGGPPNENGFPFYMAEAATSLFSADDTALQPPLPPSDGGTGGLDAGAPSADGGSGGPPDADGGVQGGGGTGGPDGGAGGALDGGAGGGSGLAGVQSIHYLNGGPAGSVPVDMTALTGIQAQATNAAGELDLFLGSGDANGAFAIPGVPAGPHYVSLNGSTFYWSNSPTDDLSQYRLGRSNGVVAAPGTWLAWSGDGMITPWANGDQLQINDTGAGIGWFNATALGFNVNAVAGGSSFSVNVPYDSWLSGSRLIDGSAGDVVYVTRLVQQPLGAGQMAVRTLQESYQTGALTMVNGADAGNVLSGTFALNGAHRLSSVTFPVSAYNAAASSVHPLATTNPNGMQFWVDAAPEGLAHGNVGGGPDLVLVTLDPAASPDPALALDYYDPFPATWSEFDVAVAQYDVQVVHPANGRARFVNANIQVMDSPAAIQARGLAPVLTPVRNLSLNAQPAQGANLGDLGLTPTISWVPSAQGLATKYSVTVWSFDNTATFTKRRVATLNAPGNVSSLQIPAGVLQSNTMYAVVVRATDDRAPVDGPPLEGSFPRYFADAVSSLFSADGTALQTPPPPADGGVP